MYCLKFKSKTNSNNIIKKISVKGQPMLQAKCSECGTTKTMFEKKI